MVPGFDAGIEQPSGTRAPAVLPLGAIRLLAATLLTGCVLLVVALAGHAAAAEPAGGGGGTSGAGPGAASLAATVPGPLEPDLFPGEEDDPEARYLLLSDLARQVAQPDTRGLEASRRLAAAALPRTGATPQAATGRHTPTHPDRPGGRTLPAPPLDQALRPEESGVLRRRPPGMREGAGEDPDTGGDAATSAPSAHPGPPAVRPLVVVVLAGAGAPGPLILANGDSLLQRPESSGSPDSVLHRIQYGHGLIPWNDNAPSALVQPLIYALVNLIGRRLTGFDGYPAGGQVPVRFVNDVATQHLLGGTLAAADPYVNLAVQLGITTALAYSLQFPLRAGSWLGSFPLSLARSGPALAGGRVALLVTGAGTMAIANGAQLVLIGPVKDWLQWTGAIPPPAFPARGGPPLFKTSRGYWSNKLFDAGAATLATGLPAAWRTSGSPLARAAAGVAIGLAGGVAKLVSDVAVDLPPPGDPVRVAILRGIGTYRELEGIRRTPRGGDFGELLWSFRVNDMLRFIQLLRAPFVAGAWKEVKELHEQAERARRALVEFPNPKGVSQVLAHLALNAGDAPLNLLNALDQTFAKYVWDRDPTNQPPDTQIRLALARARLNADRVERDLRRLFELFLDATLPGAPRDGVTDPVGGATNGPPARPAPAGGTPGTQVLPDPAATRTADGGPAEPAEVPAGPAWRLGLEAPGLRIATLPGGVPARVTEDGAYELEDGAVVRLLAGGTLEPVGRSVTDGPAAPAAADATQPGPVPALDRPAGEEAATGPPAREATGQPAADEEGSWQESTWQPAAVQEDAGRTEGAGAGTWQPPATDAEGAGQPAAGTPMPPDQTADRQGAGSDLAG